MSKNKFIKKLLVAGLCALTATAMIGATACNKDNDGDNKGSEPEQGTQQPSSKLTITFNAGEGTLNGDETVEVESGSKFPGDIPAPDAPEGYHFSHWADESGTIYIPGNTVITSSVTLKAVYAVDSAPAKTMDWYPESVGDGDASSKTFEAGDSIAETDYFNIKTTVAAKYDIGASSNIPTHMFNLTLDQNKVDQAIRQDDENLAKAGETVKSLYTVTAKEDCVLTLYVNFANLSHNSDLSGVPILYGVNGNNGNVALYTSAVNCKSNTCVTLTVTLDKDQVLTLGANNTSEKDGSVWLYGAKAEDVAENSVSVNYYDGETLLATHNVASGEKPEAPKLAVLEAGKQFDGWYTAAEDGDEYAFDAAITEDVDLYAIYYAPTTYVEGTYTYTVNSSDKTLVCAASEGATYDGNKIFELNDTTKYDAGFIKFDGAAIKVTLTLYVEAGSTVTLKISGQSGSNNKDGDTTTSWNASSIVVTPTAADEGNVITAGANNPTNNEVTVGGSDTADNTITTGTVTFTVSQSGTITLELVRGISKTARVTEIELTVAKAE